MKKSYLYMGAALLIVSAATAYFVTKNNQPQSLTIIHVNDTHSHNEPERSGQYAGMGGSLERAAFVDSVRVADGAENVLLLHAGDFCQGSSYFSEFGGKVEVDILNAMGYDAVTLGNHEFDNGIEALGQMISRLTVPVVVCNLDFSSFEAGKYIRPYIILEKAGKKIGIIGVTCSLKGVVSSEIADRIPETDIVTTVQKYADEIRPQCDLVIGLTHIGFTEHNAGALTDPQLVASTRGLDLVIGGHSHDYMDEMTLCPNLDGKKIPVVQTGWTGANMGMFHIR